MLIITFRSLYPLSFVRSLSIQIPSGNLKLNTLFNLQEESGQVPPSMPSDISSGPLFSTAHSLLISFPASSSLYNTSGLNRWSVNLLTY